MVAANGPTTTKLHQHIKPSLVPVDNLKNKEDVKNEDNLKNEELLNCRGV